VASSCTSGTISAIYCIIVDRVRGGMVHIQVMRMTGEGI